MIQENTNIIEKNTNLNYKVDAFIAYKIEDNKFEYELTEN